MKEEKVFKYMSIILKVLCIWSLTIFALRILEYQEKNASKKLSDIRAQETEEISKYQELQNEIEELSDQNRTRNVMHGTDDLLYWYNEQTYNEFKNNIKEMKKNEKVYSALPKDTQIFKVMRDVLPEHEQIGGIQYQTYFTKDTSVTDDVISLHKSFGSKDGYDLFMFGPYALVLSFDDNSNKFNSEVLMTGIDDNLNISPKKYNINQIMMRGDE
ncbi:hypothetical protein [Vagococcus luciliae]|uniref:Uncharacterized protein n=1 Tax=Vagococcus luciliae TaxID=2920380 RepID=A0ABY5NYZ3_9ENTE|nr:hypothetical protein [Vagococcus luciliae]UUV98879.1 hypothetical protein G314FT_10370 [Vagococcus luciliae]